MKDKVIVNLHWFLQVMMMLVMMKKRRRKKMNMIMTTMSCRPPLIHANHPPSNHSSKSSSNTLAHDTVQMNFFSTYKSMTWIQITLWLWLMGENTALPVRGLDYQWVQGYVHGLNEWEHVGCDTIDCWEMCVCVQC